MRTLLRQARIIDGTGSSAFEGDVLLEDDRIAEVGATTLAPDHVLDVAGMVVAPGFIDMHSHSDFTLPAEPLAVAKIHQGVTTEVVGNCGLGASPSNERVEKMYATFAPLIFGEAAASTSASLAEYRARLQAIGVSTHVASLIPHGNVRCAVMNLEERASRPDEKRQMCDLVEQGMQEGAFGLSTGLVYPPGAYAETDEVVALAEVAGRHGGYYATHLRDEGNRLEAAVEEAIQIGEQAKIGVQISHHKAAGRPNWGKVQRTLKMLDAANARGVQVHSDVYPYTAGSTVLAAIALPTWAFEGSHEEMMFRLRDPATRQRLVAASKERMRGMVDLPGLLRFIPKGLLLPIVLRKMSHIVVVSSVKHQHQYEGKTLREICRMRGQGLYDTILDLLLEEEVAVVAIAHMMDEGDVRTVMRHPGTMIGSDGFPMKGGKPHPRTFGTFPRVLSRYVREGVLTLEEAVHRMTGLTAQKLGFKERGTLTPGHAADLVVFDPVHIEDRATYENPAQAPLGIPHVFVAGVHTVRDGVHTGARAGRVLRRGE